MSKSDKKQETFSRRRFLKASAAVGAGTAVASVSAVKDPKKGTAYAKSILIKELDEFPLEISPDYQRYQQKNVGFIRGIGNDPVLGEAFWTFMDKKHGVIPPTGEVGWTELDCALGTAAWSIEADFNNFSAGGVTTGTGLYSWEGPVNERKTTFSSPEEASKIIKKASKYLGADLVGIARYEDVEKWVYADWHDPFTNTSRPAEYPFEPKSVISMAFEMDYDGYKTQPAMTSEAATGNGYSMMAFVSYKVSVFLRNLGYQAIPSGNDNALSVPIAIQAGLGELGRMGILITEQYGSRVRLAKVFTDLELKPDKPITFGVAEFCKTCMKCADNCPSESIIKDKEPSFKVHNKSNIPGVKKWNVNGETCLQFWGENGVSCGCCILVCPYNKIQEWHHDLSRLATVIPGVRQVAREFDELFGYGQIYNKKFIGEFWENLEE